ncbi:MAG: ABC transporter substrate-binding protein [Rhodocyclaceae bacterium]|nr:ABC transporter substrate-binding protein [Rhodocyclaceae bacterium]
MPKKLSQFSLRDLLVVGLPLLLAVLGAFYIASKFIKPAPPSTLIMTTGGETGAYRIFAARYRDILSRYGIELTIDPSAGSSANLARLRDPGVAVDIGFFQGGSAQAGDDETLVTLGDLYYEPLWIFYRADLADEQPLDRLAQLRGRRIAIGGPGSGTQVLARQLLSASGVEAGNSTLVESGGLELAERLRSGRIDAVMTVGPTESALVWTLLYTPGVRLMSLAHAEAYARQLPFLSNLVLPRGAIDVGKEIPVRNINLLAARATLLAREDTHPALLDLMMQAVSEVHGSSGLFQRPGEFPRASLMGADNFPLADEAKRFYTSGKPWLQRYLPFWAATLVDRMLVMLLPLIAVVVPLARIAPSLYGWRVKSHIYRRYGELKFLEAEFLEQPGRHTPAEWQARVDEIEAAVNRLRSPLTFPTCSTPCVPTSCW